MTLDLFDVPGVSIFSNAQTNLRRSGSPPQRAGGAPYHSRVVRSFRLGDHPSVQGGSNLLFELPTMPCRHFHV
jgi:hypothetical protein